MGGQRRRHAEIEIGEIADESFQRISKLHDDFGLVVVLRVESDLIIEIVLLVGVDFVAMARAHGGVAPAAAVIVWLAMVREIDREARANTHVLLCGLDRGIVARRSSGLFVLAHGLGQVAEPRELAR